MERQQQIGPKAYWLALGYQAERCCLSSDMACWCMLLHHDRIENKDFFLTWKITLICFIFTKLKFQIKIPVSSFLFSENFWPCLDVCSSKLTGRLSSEATVPGGSWGTSTVTDPAWPLLQGILLVWLLWSFLHDSSRELISQVWCPWTRQKKLGSRSSNVTVRSSLGVKWSLKQGPAVKDFFLRLRVVQRGSKLGQWARRHLVLSSAGWKGGAPGWRTCFPSHSLGSALRWSCHDLLLPVEILVSKVTFRLLFPALVMCWNDP